MAHLRSDVGVGAAVSYWNHLQVVVLEQRRFELRDGGRNSYVWSGMHSVRAEHLRLDASAGRLDSNWVA